MRKSMIPAPSQAKGNKKPQSEFEEFNDLGRTLFNTPKKNLSAPKKKQAYKAKEQVSRWVRE